MSVFESSPPATITTMLSTPSRATPIAKTYREAVRLFLTRRLPEALSTIEPVITAGRRAEQPTFNAPIASASRSTRVKVWTFYLTFLNALIELGPEEGKLGFGSAKWKSCVSKVRNGDIWDEVVQAGYHGIAEDVDGDIVVNISTLLITHAPNQKLTQDRLENYLSSSLTPISPYNSPPGNRTPINYPRSSHTILRLIEIYVLHVLPRNGEWDYAREYVSMSEMLDNDRKEAFLLSLHNLRQAELQHQTDQLQREDAIRRKRQAETRSIEAEAKRREDELRRLAERERRRQEQQQQQVSPTPAQRPSALRSGNARRSAAGISVRSPPAGSRRREQAAVLSVRARLSQMLRSSAALRSIIVASLVLVMLGRSDVRRLLSRVLALTWSKVVATVGMGLKVSYL